MNRSYRILAHVDAGKTTLSRPLLYRAGANPPSGRWIIRPFSGYGRHGRQRGSPISKQACLSGIPDIPCWTRRTRELFPRMVRTLQVLDSPFLISAPTACRATPDAVGSAGTLSVPTFLFINKMDLAGRPGALLAHLKDKLSRGCVDFGNPKPVWRAAVCDETALERYLDTERCRMNISPWSRMRDLFSLRHSARR